MEFWHHLMIIFFFAQDAVPKTWSKTAKLFALCPFLLWQCALAFPLWPFALWPSLLFKTPSWLRHVSRLPPCEACFQWRQGWWGHCPRWPMRWTWIPWMWTWAPRSTCLPLLKLWCWASCWELFPSLSWASLCLPGSSSRRVQLWASENRCLVAWV